MVPQNQLACAVMLCSQASAGFMRQTYPPQNNPYPRRCQKVTEGFSHPMWAWQPRLPLYFSLWQVIQKGTSTNNVINKSWTPATCGQDFGVYMLVPQGTHVPSQV